MCLLLTPYISPHVCLGYYGLPELREIYLLHWFWSLQIFLAYISFEKSLEISNFEATLVPSPLLSLLPSLPLSHGGEWSIAEGNGLLYKPCPKVLNEELISYNLTCKIRRKILPTGICLKIPCLNSEKHQMFGEKLKSRVRHLLKEILRPCLSVA